MNTTQKRMGHDIPVSDLYMTARYVNFEVFTWPQHWLSMHRTPSDISEGDIS